MKGIPKELELGKFVRWGEHVTVDLARKVFQVLPIARPEEIVEIPAAEQPADDDLQTRTTSL